jgi:hypothetical protein
MDRNGMKNTLFRKSLSSLSLVNEKALTKKCEGKRNRFVNGRVNKEKYTSLLTSP